MLLYLLNSPLALAATLALVVITGVYFLFRGAKGGKYEVANKVFNYNNKPGANRS